MIGLSLCGDWMNGYSDWVACSSQWADWVLLQWGLWVVDRVTGLFLAGFGFGSHVPIALFICKKEEMFK